jgi:hypothetical protein
MRAVLPPRIILRNDKRNGHSHHYDQDQHTGDNILQHERSSRNAAHRNNEQIHRQPYKKPVADAVEDAALCEKGKPRIRKEEQRCLRERDGQMKHDAEARSQPTAVKRASSERAAGNVLKDINGIHPTHEICLCAGSNAVQEAGQQPSGENCAEWSNHCYQERLVVFPAEARSKNDLSLFICLL